MSRVGEQIVAQNARIIPLLMQQISLLTHLTKEVMKMTAQHDAVLADVADLKSKFESFAGSVSTKLADLKAQIAALQAASTTPEDFSDVLAAVDTVKSEVDTAQGTLADAPPPAA